MINIFNKQQAGSGYWEVWTDTEIQERDGRIIGVGQTMEDAVKIALEELEDDLRQLKRELP